ncbi:hypothetical protein EBU71_08970 [bacterium]|nr:hypothetical protein [Candidatus Elulimicrobium humile]
MPRSRTLYNVQALFVAPFSGSFLSPYLNGYKILRPIKNLQTIDYSINQDNANIITFGNKSNVFVGASKPPEATLQFAYFADGLTNERRLNFNAYSDFDPKSELLKNLAFSGLDLAAHKDKKDFYLIVNKSENDIYRKDTDFNSSFLNPSSEASVIDQKSIDYAVLHFQNAYLKKYSFSISSRSIGLVSQEYVADNIVYYNSGSGINYTILNLKSGNNENQQEKIIIPRSLRNLSGQDYLFGQRAKVSFSKSISNTVLFEADLINSFNFTIDFSRNDSYSFNYRFPRSRNIKYPVYGKLDISLNATGNLTGSFFDTLNKNIDYNVFVNFSPTSPINPQTSFLFSGCRFNNISYDNSIGDAYKNVNLSFNFEQDFSNNSKGLFWSGNMEYGFLAQPQFILQ